PGAEQPVPDVDESRRPHQLSQVARPGEPAHACREIRVGSSTRKKLADQRHALVEPDSIERCEYPLRLCDLEHTQATSGTQDAPQLRQRAVEILDVADTEADRRRV